MKRIHLMILGGTFILLAGLYFWQQQRPQTSPVTDLYTILVPEMDLASIDALEAWSPEDKDGRRFRLRKKDGLWWVDRGFSAPVKKDRVERLLQTLKDLKGETRASGQEVFATFDLEDDRALHLALREGDRERAHLIVGKRGTTWDTVFMRRTGSNEIYLASKNLLSLFDIWSERAEKTPEARVWLDLSVVAEGPQRIEGLSYRRGEIEWSLVAGGRQDERQGETLEAEERKDVSQGQGTDEVKRTWLYVYRGQKGEDVTKEEVEGLLSELFPLDAKDVVSPDEAGEIGLGVEDQEGRLTVHSIGKGIRILHLGRRDEEKGLGWIRNERGVIYEVEAEWLAKVHKPFGE